MSFWAWVIAAFLSGSIPYSVLVGQWAGAGDIRRVGDGNPGATNVGRALGWRWFTAAMLLDGFKGAIPVGLAYYVDGVRGWELVVIATVPVLGHAFSPWLNLRGGKAVATTFGIWAGLTLWAGPILLGIFLTLTYKLVRVSGWAMMLAFALLGVVVLVFYLPRQPELGAIWVLNALVLAVKHRADLSRPPGLRPWVSERLHR